MPGRKEATSHRFVGPSNGRHSCHSWWLTDALPLIEFDMLRMKPIADARKAESYYAKSDGGYYLDAGGLHREWGGKAAARLGLAGPPDFEQFRRLAHGLDPHTASNSPPG